MPRPPHLCPCGAVVPHGARCQCQRKADAARKARHDARRPGARQRGYTAEWERERAAFLLHHPACTMCSAPASIVDHVTPHRGDRKLFWNRTNWQPLCKPCHDRHKQQMDRASQEC